MSFVLAAPDALVSAASDLAGIGSAISTANAAAAPPTTGVLAAAADEVSAHVAALFSEHALGYQQLSAQVSEFHQRFVQALSAGANAYASAEAGAAQALAGAVGAAAQTALGHLGSGAAGLLGGNIVANAVNHVKSAVLGGGGAAGLLGNGASGLLGGSAAGATRALGALLAPAAMTNAAAVPAANALLPIGTAIENAYLAIEPWVAYGFTLAEWAVRWLPLIGILAPQITYFYNLFEPIVQSVLFNTIDFLDGTVTFAQGLANIQAATGASINQFIATEIYWIRSFFPPLPPIGVNVP